MKPTLFIFSVVIAAIGASLSASVADEPIVSAAVWERLQQATVRIEVRGERASGVFLTDNGIVLTAAHAVPKSTTTLRLKLTDGRTFSAKVLQRNAQLDFAILQAELKPNEVVTFLPLAPTNRSVQRGEFLLAAGFPAREDAMATAVIRAGKLRRTVNRSLDSSCALTVGDSGGPLVLANGWLIGINQRIGRKGVNLHLPVTALRQTFQQHSNWFVAAEAQPPGPTFPTARQTELVDSLTVEILPHRNKAPLCLGTLVSADRIVTKWSEVAPNTQLFCRHRKTLHRMTFVKSDRTTDLALFTIAKPLEFSSPTFGKPAVGEFVECGGSKIGLLTRVDHDEPAAPLSLGCSVQPENGKLSIVSVYGPSAKAGVRAGSRLLAIDDTSIERPEQISDCLKQYQPGDVIALTLELDGNIETRPVKLGESAATMLDRKKFLDGFAVERSARCSGFEKALQHDAPLEPQQMGGPLLNQSGQLIGLNIARAGRESVLALPWKAVQQFIKQ